MLPRLPFWHCWGIIPHSPTILGNPSTLTLLMGRRPKNPGFNKGPKRANSFHKSTHFPMVSSFCGSPPPILQPFGSSSNQFWRFQPKIQAAFDPKCSAGILPHYGRPKPKMQKLFDPKSADKVLLRVVGPSNCHFYSKHFEPKCRELCDSIFFDGSFWLPFAPKCRSRCSKL